MTTYVWRDGKWRDKATGKPMPNEDKGFPVTFRVMPDITAFVSPLDFKTEISSRSALREYEKRHGVKQVGTDWDSTAKRIQQHS
jgi:hypothetical protein